MDAAGLLIKWRLGLRAHPGPAAPALLAAALDNHGAPADALSPVTRRARLCAERCLPPPLQG